MLVNRKTNMKSVIFITNEAVASHCGAMEAETISKNGASPKSQMSRRNILVTFLALFLCCTSIEAQITPTIAKKLVNLCLYENQQTRAFCNTVLVNKTGITSTAELDEIYNSLHNRIDLAEEITYRIYLYMGDLFPSNLGDSFTSTEKDIMRKFCEQERQVRLEQEQVRLEQERKSEQERQVRLEQERLEIKRQARLEQARQSRLEWKITNGTLTISGTGVIPDYDSESTLDRAPWYSERNSFTNVVIENGVTSIGNYAFAGCSGIKSVTIPNSVTSIGIAAFFDCGGLTSVTIPESVTTIGNRAFAYCRSLTSVAIPSSVTYIGMVAFMVCRNLTEVINYATTPQVITTSGVFDNVDKSKVTLYAPANAISTYRAANAWNDFKNIVAIK